MSKFILVTGACGYLGPGIIKNLLGRGHRVLGIDHSDRDNPISDCAGFELRRSDLATVDNELFKFTGVPDACLHLAWRNGFNHNASSHIEELSEHFNFLIRMAKSGVGQITVAGSVHEVGYFEGEVKESTFAKPRSLYGLAKNTLRESLEIKLEEFNVSFQWLRLFYIVGEAARGQSVFSKILEKDKAGVLSFPFTSGKNKFDFIEISELENQIAAVLNQTTVNGIIHCCSGTAESIREKIDVFIRDNKLKIRPEYGALQDRPYDSPEIWGDISKIKKILETDFKKIK